MADPLTVPPPTQRFSLEPISLGRRIGTGVLIALATIFTVGINLRWQSQKDLWSQVISCKKIVPLQPSQSPQAKKIGVVGERALQQKPSVERLCQLGVDIDGTPKLRIGAAGTFSDLTGEESGTNQCYLHNTHLHECHCDPATTREGIFNVSSRTQLELRLTQTVAALIKNGTINKDKPLVICSIYPGGLLQELILHINLSKLGLQVHWVLADPYFKEEEGKKSLDDFCSYTAGISQKQGASPPTVTTLDSWREWQAIPALLNRSQTTNPVLWLAIDTDAGQQEDADIGVFLRSQEADIRAILDKRQSTPLTIIPPLPKEKR